DRSYTFCEFRACYRSSLERIRVRAPYMRGRFVQRKQRISQYFELSTALSSLNSASLCKLLNSSEKKDGWGSTHIFEIAGKKVFAKKLPLTQLEFDSGFSTRNLFNL